MLSIANQEAYADLTPEQIVPKLADQGQYLASTSSFYRVFKESKQDKKRGRQKPSKPRPKPQELVATEPNQIYSWDITYLKSHVLGLFFYLYLVIDIFSRKIVGWQIHEQERSELSAKLMLDIAQREGIVRDQIYLHSDNGGPMKGATMLVTLQKLGIAPSFSRPSVSNDNPYSESLFKTLKYCPVYPKDGFADILEARQWMVKFDHWYNHEHHHSSIRYVTPHQRHTGQDKEILLNRTTLFEQAKSARPDRWSGRTRNWQYIDRVVLNPGKPLKIIS